MGFASFFQSLFSRPRRMGSVQLESKARFRTVGEFYQVGQVARDIGAQGILRMTPDQRLQGDLEGDYYKLRDLVERLEKGRITGAPMATDSMFAPYANQFTGLIVRLPDKFDTEGPVRP